MHVYLRTCKMYTLTLYPFFNSYWWYMTLKQLVFLLTINKNISKAKSHIAQDYDR